MKNFLDKEFLLENDTACALYHDYAENMPIIDFHNHLFPQDIYEKRQYEDLTELWLETDHYKWRAMRAQGIDEKYISGNADNREKFRAWSHTIENLVGSPLYHWTHLELRRYFGIEQILCPETSDAIFDGTAEMLAQNSFNALGLLEKMNVRILCTVNDPFEDLCWHRKIAEHNFPFKVIPTFRPDKYFDIDKIGFADNLKKLESLHSIKITTFDDLKCALCASLDNFAKLDCTIADVSLSDFTYVSSACGASDILKAALSGMMLTKEQIRNYKSELLTFLSREYTRRGMVSQFHLGALRDNSTFLLNTIGHDAGGDSIGHTTDMQMLSNYLNDMDKDGILPKTVLYTLNQSEYTALITMAVNFARNMPGRIQLGTAWWFLDTKRGMQYQLDELMETGLLSSFVGMVTDSRSVTSFCRHEYFRRVLCNKIGKLVEQGEYPRTVNKLGEIVQNICFNNANDFFEFRATV